MTANRNLNVTRLPYKIVVLPSYIEISQNIINYEHNIGIKN